jgi:hypothetical protein
MIYARTIGKAVARPDVLARSRLFGRYGQTAPWYRLDDKRLQTPVESFRCRQGNSDMSHETISGDAWASTDWQYRRVPLRALAVWSRLGIAVLIRRGPNVSVMSCTKTNTRSSRNPSPIPG